MTSNEKELCRALVPVIEGVNFLADLVTVEDVESDRIDLLDRIGSGIEAGLIELKVDPSLFSKGKLKWPTKEQATYGDLMRRIDVLKDKGLLVQGSYTSLRGMAKTSPEAAENFIKNMQLEKQTKIKLSSIGGGRNGDV